MAKTVLITGASKGIGRKMAELFAQNNYNVIINYNHSAQEAKQLQAEILEKYKVKTLLIQADISQEEDVKKMVKESLHTFTKIDVLINNAALSKDEDIWEKSIESFKQVIDVNLIGTFLMCQYVGKEMLKAQDGCIINIASTNGIDTLNTYSADYDASKAGVISLTHNFAKSLAPYIRVNAIAPGWTNTESVLEMNPNILKTEKEKILLKRFADPEEIANVALFLASDKANYINSSVIRVDGGQA